MGHHCTVWQWCPIWWTQMLKHSLGKNLVYSVFHNESLRIMRWAVLKKLRNPKWFYFPFTDCYSTKKHYIKDNEYIGNMFIVIKCFYILCICYSLTRVLCCKSSSKNAQSLFRATAEEKPSEEHTPGDCSAQTSLCARAFSIYSLCSEQLDKWLRDVFFFSLAEMIQKQQSAFYAMQAHSEVFK